MSILCSNCIYRDEASCKRYPPVMVDAQAYGGGKWGHPPVHLSTTGCGEHKTLAQAVKKKGGRPPKKKVGQSANFKSGSPKPAGLKEEVLEELGDMEFKEKT